MIKAPCIIDGMSNDEYHAGPGISNSGLALMAQAPRLFWHRYLDPNRQPLEPKSGQLEGTLCHAATLEPDAFGSRYAMTPADAPPRPQERWRDAKKPSEETIAAFAYWDNWTLENRGRETISAAQYDTAMRQAESIRALPEIRELLSAGKPEQSAYAIDPVTGVLIRCRPDWAHQTGDSGFVLLDVKTCGDPSPDEFARQVARKGYHRQHPFYSDTFSLATSKAVHGFVFVGVMSQWPYLASACMLDEPSIEAGRASYRAALNRYYHCLQADEWPAYGDDINLITLPRWIMNKENA